MRFAYYCNSPYQLITILNLNYQRKFNSFENIENYQSDLIVLNSFPNANNILDVIRKNNFFDNIYIAQRVKNNNKLSSLLDVLFPFRYLSKAYNASKEKTINYYNYISTPKISRVSYSLWILNRKAKIHLHEEGVASFFGGKHMCHEDGMHQELYKLVNRGKDFFSYEKMYLNNTLLYLDNDKEKLVQIPAIDNKLLELLKNSYTNLELRNDNKSIYWLGQYFEDAIHDTTYEIIKEKKKEVVYCPHPRLANDNTYDFDRLNTSLIWELNLLNIKDISNKCLLTIHSTAALSPKILYDEEPYIIFTVYMIEEKHINSNVENMKILIEKLKKIYRNPEKIILPKSNKELGDYVDAISFK